MGMELAALTVLTGAECAHGFGAFAPSVFTIRTLARERGAEGIAHVRAGYVPAVILGLILGVTVSAITDSPLPLIGAVLVIAVMLLAYEWAIRG